MLLCCNCPQKQTDNITIDSHAEDTAVGETTGEQPDERLYLDDLKRSDTSNSKDSRGKGKGRGKGKEKHRHSRQDSGGSKPAPIDYFEGVPMLPTQLQMVSGSWSWIRQSNDPQARHIRLEAGLLLQEAFKKGGYAVKIGGKPKKTTFSHLPEMIKGTKCISVKAGLPAIGKDPKHKTKFEYGGHPIERAAEFTLEGYSTVTVNAASAYHAGGGFTSGGRHALEEAFCSQSTLYPSLEKVVADMGEHKEGAAHVPVDGVILSPHVELFRRGSEQGYPVHRTLVKIAGVVSVAMFNRNPRVKDSPLDAPENKEEYVRGCSHKLKAMVHAALVAGADALIVPDVGCGVFENDPVLVGRLAGEAIAEYVGYFRRILFTGKHEFFNSVSKTLMVQLVKTAVGGDAGALKATDHRACQLCGKPLGGDHNELCLLLNPTGHRADGLCFLHAECADKISDRWPDYTAMQLPVATSDPDSFLRALDVDGNGILSKDEVFCAVSALWSGDPAKLESEFEAKWKLWDTNASGDLDVSEIAEIPKTFVAWLKESATSASKTAKDGGGFVDDLGAKPS